MVAKIVNERGVTLIELLVVVAVIGILVALTSVALDVITRETRLLEARDRLIADLEDIKFRSVTSVPHGIAYNAAGDGYAIVRLKDGRCVNAGGVPTGKFCILDTDCPGFGAGETCSPGNLMVDAVELADIANSFETILGRAVEMPRDVTIAPAGQRFWFDRKGLPRSDAWALAMGTVTLTRDAVTKTVAIDSVGRIQYEQ